MLGTYTPLRPLCDPRAVIYKARGDDLTAVEALAQKLEPGLAKAILDALTAQGNAVPLDALVAALESGDVGKVVALLDTPEVTAAFAAMTPKLQGAVYAGGALGAGAIATQMRGVSFVFDQLNPRLLTWLQTYNLGLIREISDQTKEGIREYLLAGMTAGRNPGGENCHRPDSPAGPGGLQLPPAAGDLPPAAVGQRLESGRQDRPCEWHAGADAR